MSLEIEFGRYTFAEALLRTLHMLLLFFFFIFVQVDAAFVCCVPSPLPASAPTLCERVAAGSCGTPHKTPMLSEGSRLCTIVRSRKIVVHDLVRDFGGNQN